MEYLKQAKAADYQQNRDRYLASTQAYREANRVKINAWFKYYREANPEKMKAKKSKYYEANKERLLPKFKAYRQDHPEYARLSCHKRKARMRNAPGTCSRKQFLAKIEYHGWRCYLCKSSLSIKELQMDHRVPLARGGSNWPANLAPACKPCNLSKATKTEKEFRQRIVETNHVICLPNCPSESAVARDVNS